MKVALLTDVRKLEIKERDIPKIDDHSVLLKVKAVGVCGSDLRIYRNGDARVAFPRVMGHEIAGIVTETGKYVNGLAVDDRVALGAHIPCGTCDYCLEGNGHHCVKRWSIGYQFDGGFAEYVVLNRLFVENGTITKFSKNTTFEEASLSEPLSCVISGLKKLSIQPAETVVVFGAGAIGGMFIAALRKMGAGKIIVVQRSEKRRKFAEQLGADLVIDPSSQNPVQAILEETDGYGCDVVINTAPSNDAQNQSLLSVRKKGRVLFFSCPPSEKNSLDTKPIIYNELSIFGIHGATRSDHRMAIKWIDSKFIDFSQLITHRFVLSEIEDAFQQTEMKQGVKSVVMPEL
ncbi:alcohol dehydrogenase catalytic domain-containing protein [Neobacillus sp. MM2021_6]|uniref:zinc-binding dehydrogenase n=1 Tax=Bacillaceae TaxID=186817 RepID=UPI001408343C|nr:MULTISPECIES: alcohol dehydrogenase catalytic domain-containing protein [Bacillaceae]MBO0958667.1 alcohol dehydrogenase catalytic domain-containing protein [Neobacillus sp. MM2021_6]NHC20193.1 alcohol dehydrogenase catalytic domain-containing protein [Bacillus sp. MM2020_4]